MVMRPSPIASEVHARHTATAHVERALRGWCRHRIGDLGHEDRVADHAEKLFDLLAPLHRLDASDRRLLRWSAWVHDVGRCVADEGHERHGAYLLATASGLPLEHAERHLLAYLTRRHRGKVPRLDGFLDERASRRRTRTLLALLRAADALDTRRSTPPTIVLSRQGMQLQIHAFAPALNRHLVKLQEGKKFALLRDVLHVETKVQIHLTDAVTVQRSGTP